MKINTTSLASSVPITVPAAASEKLVIVIPTQKFKLNYIEEEVLTDPSIKDINTLKKYLLKKYPKMKKHLDNDNLIRVAINLSYTFENETIKDDDEIAFFPPVSGG